MQHFHRVTVLLCALLLAASSVPAWADTESGGPELQDVSLSRSMVSPGSSVEVGANGWDEDGIRSILLRFEEENTKTILTVTLKESAPGAEMDSLCNGTLVVPSTAPEGVYRLKSASLTDKNGNRSLYRRQEDLRDGDEELEETPSFQVKKDSGSFSPVNCQVGDSSLSAGGSTFLSLAVSPTYAGFEKATVIFQNPQNGRKFIQTLKQEDWVAQNTYRTILEIPSYEPKGTYSLFKITLEDSSGQSVTYAANGEKDSLPLPVSSSFTVGPEEGDSTPPQLQSVVIAKSRVRGNNREYLLQVKASDSLSGVDHITLRFSNDETGRSVSKVLTQEDRENGLYSGWLEVSLFEPDGTFYLDNVGLMDEAKNYQAYCRPQDVSENNHKLPLSQAVSFTLQNGAARADETGPELCSVNLSRTSLSAGGSLTVSASAKDDISGVDSIKLQFKNGEGKSINLTLKKDGANYSGKVKSFQTKQEGTYGLCRATLTDQAGNTQVYTLSPQGSEKLLTLRPSFQIHDSH